MKKSWKGKGSYVNFIFRQPAQVLENCSQEQMCGFTDGELFKWLALLSSVVTQGSENENGASRNTTAVQTHEPTHLVMLCWLTTLPGTMGENRNISGLFK